MKRISFRQQIVSEEDLSDQLKNNPEATELDISESSVTSLSFLQDRRLDSLVELNVSSTKLKDFSALTSATVPNLRSFHANNVDFNDLNFLSGLTNLQEVACEFSNVTCLDSFKDLKKLRKLILTGNKQVVDLAPLSGLTELNELYLQETGITQREQLIPIGNIKFERLLTNESISSQADLLLKREETGAYTNKFF